MAPNDASDVPFLVARCCRGDERAWQEFVGRFHTTVARLAYRLADIVDRDGGDRREIAEDLVQEVYVRLLARDCQALRAWRGGDAASMTAYLATIVRAAALDALRRRKSLKRSIALVPIDAAGDDEVPLRDRLAAPEADSPERQLFDRRLAARLDGLLRSISTGEHGARNALVFRLHHFDGLSPREIAAIAHLGLTVSNVESVLRRTRERLRARLESPSDLTG